MPGKESTSQKLHDQDKDVKIGKWREKGVDYCGKRAVSIAELSEEKKYIYMYMHYFLIIIIISQFVLIS